MYNIQLSLNAQEELENAEFFYSNISEKVADKFIESTSKTFSLLKNNPYFSIRYKIIGQFLYPNFLTYYSLK